MKVLLIMAYRQLKRFIRARSRVVGSIVNPLIWIVFFGLGWSNVFRSPMVRQVFDGVDYLTYLVPGIVAMTIFSGSFISGVTVLWDKQFGFLKEILVAPASRSEAIIGRALGDAITALIQGIAILLLSFLIAGELKIVGVPAVLLIGFIQALGFTSIGIVMALKISSTEGFHVIVNFLMLPLIFLSGAFYPIDAMPNWMKVIAYINPLTYAVDGMRYYLVGSSKFPITLDLGVLTVSSTILLVIVAYLFEKATIE